MFWERTRAAGRSLLSIGAYYGAVAAVALGIGALLPIGPVQSPAMLALTSLPVVVAALAINAVMATRRWASWPLMGWPERRAGLRGLGAGMLLGVGMALTALALALAAGGARVVRTGEPVSAYLAVAAGLVAMLAIAALAEELLFRGYPLARLAQGVGRVGASLVLALAFALLHLGNPEISPMGLANIGLAGLVMSAAFFTPGALPAAWGVHLGWNAGLAVSADAPVSGIALGVPMLDFAPGQPVWISGGAFGPEGGLAATVAMSAALMWLVHVANRGEGAAP